MLITLAELHGMGIVHRDVKVRAQPGGPPRREGRERGTGPACCVPVPLPHHDAMCAPLPPCTQPENLFLDLEGRLLLGDFGLAAESSDALTERVGTLDYMAPEVRHARRHGHRNMAFE